MSKVYFNLKSSQGRETVDELDTKDFNSMKEFRKERRRLLDEYHMTNINVYLSSRMCANWR